MRVLYLHQNFPAQYRHIAAHLSRQGGHVQVAVAKTTAGRVAGVKHIHYDLGDTPTRSQNGYVTDFETKTIHAQMVRDVLINLRQRGFTPEIVLSHPGWGEAMFVKDVYPDSPRLDYCEFYYNAHGADVNFDPEQQILSDDTARIRSRNAAALMSLDSCDWGLSPTRWQRSQYPRGYHDKISVLHDGIDTEHVVPDPACKLTLPNGAKLTRRDEVVTFVARNLEPYRGFHQFMRAAKYITERRPNLHIIVVGGDGVSYGRRLPEGETYRARMLNEVPLDLNRVHFVGRLEYEKYLKVLQISSVHIYLTVPFVLSWSMLESMSAGCLVLGSDTPPVAEVIDDGQNGLLVDFFSPRRIADRVDEVFDHPDRMADVRRAARATVLDHYALSLCLPKHLNLISEIADRRLPPPSATTLTGKTGTTNVGEAPALKDGPLIVAPSGTSVALPEPPPSPAGNPG